MDHMIESTTTVMVLSNRIPGMSFEDYKSYYEDRHVPLVEGLFMHGDNRPLSYTRNYIERDMHEETASSFPFGGAETWHYDCIARVVFRDPQHRDSVFAEFAKHRETIAADEAHFLDSSTLKVIYVTESCSNVRKD